MKRLLKTGLANGAHWARLDRIIALRRGLDRAPLVVGYHRVVENFEFSARTAIPSLLVSTKTLEQHIDWIAGRYRFVTLDELARMYTAAADGDNAAFDGKPVAAITFDDGYRDVYEHAFPLLRRKGVPFSAFVVTDHVESDQLQVHDELYLLALAVLDLGSGDRADCWKSVIEAVSDESGRVEALCRQIDTNQDPYRATRQLLHGLDARELRTCMAALRSRLTIETSQRQALLSMDWDMLREMHAKGGTIGSHTQSHPLLAASSEDVVRKELEESRELLERQLGKPIRHLAYPDGSFSESVVRAASDAGYDTAVTTCQRISPAFPALTIPRRMLWEHASHGSHGKFSPAILSCLVSGVFDATDRRAYAH